MTNRQYITGFSRGYVRRELDDHMDEFDDEDFDDYHPDKFDRRQINRALGKRASGSYEEARDEIHDAGSDPIARLLAAQRADPHD
jgi:hypothetical protein